MKRVLKCVPRVDITGQRFGRLVVECLVGKGERGFLWKCKCDCGNTKIAPIVALHRGTSSCGCKYIESRKRAGEQMIKNNTKPHGVADFQYLYRRYRDGARRRKVSFELSEEEFRVLTSGPCVYCGTIASHISRNDKKCNGNYLYNGIDRLDSKEGYVKENCVSCCKACNYAKSALSIEEFTSWLNGLLTYRRTVSLEETLGNMLKIVNINSVVHADINKALRLLQDKVISQ